MRSISAAESPRIMRRPNPHRSLKPGWAPMATPFAFARSAVRNMMLGSPACQPQATLADDDSEHGLVVAHLPGPESLSHVAVEVDVHLIARCHPRPERQSRGGEGIHDQA